MPTLPLNNAKDSPCTVSILMFFYNLIIVVASTNVWLSALVVFPQKSAWTNEFPCWRKHQTRPLHEGPISRIAFARPLLLPCFEGHLKATAWAAVSAPRVKDWFNSLPVNFISSRLSLLQNAAAHLLSAQSNSFVLFSIAWTIQSLASFACIGLESTGEPRLSLWSRGSAGRGCPFSVPGTGRRGVDLWPRPKWRE